MSAGQATIRWSCNVTTGGWSRPKPNYPNGFDVSRLFMFQVVLLITLFGSKPSTRT